ncbi:MAG: ATP-binding cassette domain-containing protein [Arachidicoccus sp.]|nr:ATP-binding cassette domain-containing protein [Arachidicoccus sp.]
MLVFNNFEKSYSDALVIKTKEFRLEKGVYWLKGINGSGKSTLIKAAAGLISFKGNILLDNISLKKFPTIYKRKINFADAEPLFPEFLTGNEMIKLFIDAKEGSQKDTEEFIINMQMQHYLQSPIGSYSSGMLKKLSLILAFIGTPDWILLDEPFITLDSDSLIAIQHQINHLYKKSNIGFLFSSHQIDNLHNLSLSDEIIIENKMIKKSSK